MDEAQKEKVKQAYIDQGYKEVKIVGARELSKGNIFAAVCGTDEDDDDFNEICMIQGDIVRIFDGDMDLICSIDRPPRISEWIVTGNGVSAIAFFVCLFSLIIFGAFSADSGNAFDAIKQIGMLAAGFFLGNARK